MSTPRGIRNCNPLNIRKSRDEFQGEVVPSQDSAFKQFKSMAWGYRAAFVTLSSYLKAGRNTISKIIGAWAPPTENHTDSYIANVSKGSGVDKDKVLTAASGSDYRKIVAAMSRCENGVAAKMTEVTAGFGLQDRLKG